VELALAWVTELGDDGCLVVPVGESEAETASYAEPFRRNAASMSPGCLVALDRSATPAAVVYRWFPARVLVVDGARVECDEPFHGVINAYVRDGVPVPRISQTVYASIGLTDEWRIDATEADAHAAAAALSEIDDFYARLADQ